MKHLIVRNDPPYGTERSFNGLRMAGAARATMDALAQATLTADKVLVF